MQHTTTVLVEYEVTFEAPEDATDDALWNAAEGAYVAGLMVGPYDHRFPELEADANGYWESDTPETCGHEERGLDGCVRCEDGQRMRDTH